MRLTFESLDGVKADVLPNECGLIQSTEDLHRIKRLSKRVLQLFDHLSWDIGLFWPLD